jgi:hypothetical protein
MLSVKTYDHLHEVTGGPRPRKAPTPAPVPAPAPAVPAPAPAPVAPPAPVIDMSGLQDALMEIAQRQAQNTAAMREFINRPKKLKADIVRDDEGRMSVVIINIIEE